MRRTAWLLVLLAGCAPSVPPMPVDDPPAVVEPQETLVVYSLEPLQLSPLKAEHLKPGEKAFRGWVRLGSTTVTDPAVRKEILEQVREAIEEGKKVPLEDRKACLFSPRHALHHVAKDGTETDFLICFSCGQVQEFRNGEAVRFEVMHNGRVFMRSFVGEFPHKPQKRLNDTLTAAGVKLADGAE